MAFLYRMNRECAAMGDRRVVVTGIGLVSAGGMTGDSVHEFLISGRSAVISTESLGDIPVPCYAPVSDFQGKISDFGNLPPEIIRPIRKGLKLMCRETQMGVAAAQFALADSGWTPGMVDPDRIGVSCGCDHLTSDTADFEAAAKACLTAMGREGQESMINCGTWGEYGIPRMSPLWLLLYLPNMPASHVAIYNDLRGPSNSVMLREVSAAASIGEAAAVIRRGRTEMMLAGATGTRIHPVRLVHFTQQEQIATKETAPDQACRPFDVDRTGAVPGEGAACVVLEDYEHAKRRGATIHAEILAADTAVAFHAPGRPDQGTALRMAIRRAMERSGKSGERPGCCVAYAQGTRAGDAQEAAALEEMFGQTVPVTAVKDRWGNPGCGGGMMEFVAGLMAMKKRMIPAIRNCRKPDPAFHLDLVREPRAFPGDQVMSVTMNAQGQAGVILAGRAD
ncbi:MAG: beta-ketoacyl synthase N-terminal-like domain-containing protein [Planctomycetia bacterium]|nr:beta-ketoacyl synthase N-terminal-like domain-containing protein [Planctomycetia bacterium]